MRTGIEILNESFRGVKILFTKLERVRPLRWHDKLDVVAKLLFSALPPALVFALGDDFALHQLFELIEVKLVATAAESQLDQGY